MDYDHQCICEWIVPQFHNLRPKMAKSIVYVITLITNRNHAFHCLNYVSLSFYHKPISHWIKIDHVPL